MAGIRVLADEHIKFTILTAKPANPAAPTAAELNAGIDASCLVLADNFQWSAADSDRGASPVRGHRCRVPRHRQLQPRVLLLALVRLDHRCRRRGHGPDPPRRQGEGHEPVGLRAPHRQGALRRVGCLGRDPAGWRVRHGHPAGPGRVRLHQVHAPLHGADDARLHHGRRCLTSTPAALVSGTGAGAAGPPVPSLSRK